MAATGKAADAAANGAPSQAHAELEARVAELEANSIGSDAFGEKVEEIAGNLVRAELKSLAAKLDEQFGPVLEALEKRAATSLDEELEKALRFLHGKIDAVHRGLERAVGITVQMPQQPDEEVTAHPKVTGAETAGSLP